MFHFRPRIFNLGVEINIFWGLKCCSRDDE